MENTPIAFFLALKFSSFDEIQQKVKQYIEPDSSYLVVGEKSPDTHQQTNGEHFHFLVNFSEKSYKNFTKHFIEKYKLRGSAKDGKSRQYGKIKKIKDLERLHQYMLKDLSTDNPIFTNYENDEIDAWAAKSFKKESKKNYLDSMSDKLTKSVLASKPDPSTTLGISMDSLQFHLFLIHLEEQKSHDSKKAITKSQLHSLANYWVQFKGLKAELPEKLLPGESPWIAMEPEDKYNFLFTYNY